MWVDYITEEIEERNIYTWAGVSRAGGRQADRVQAGHSLAVHLARHLSEGGTVRELGATSDEGEDGFALNE